MYMYTTDKAPSYITCKVTNYMLYYTTIYGRHIVYRCVYIGRGAYVNIKWVHT